MEYQKIKTSIEMETEKGKDQTSKGSIGLLLFADRSTEMEAERQALLLQARQVSRN